MDDNKSYLVEDQPDETISDIITDLKVGIYNLFTSLLNHYIVTYGPEKALELSLEYLQTIIDGFSQALPDKNK